MRLEGRVIDWGSDWVKIETGTTAMITKKKIVKDDEGRDKEISYQVMDFLKKLIGVPSGIDLKNKRARVIIRT